MTPKELFDIEKKIYDIWKSFDTVYGEDVPHIRISLANAIAQLVRMRLKMEAEVVE